MIIFLSLHQQLYAQNGGGSLSQDISNRIKNAGGGMNTPGNDSLQHRDNTDDSITLVFHRFDSTTLYILDSSVHDFYRRFPMPPANLYLGNLGSPTKSMLFSPWLKPGFDPGFHGFDAYRFTVENTKVYQTTRPYSELDYIIGSKNEQTIHLLHTQNIRPSWNALFEYKFLNSPGHFKNSNTTHSAIRLTTSFATKNKRYSGNAMFITNRNRASENGGIRADSFLQDKTGAYDERFNIPTWIGGDGEYGANFFSTSINTGTEQKTRTFFLRHQYDLGQKDSTYGPDSALIRLFYPRFRLQHTFSYTSSLYSYFDKNTTDSVYNRNYLERYNLTITNAPLNLSDRWHDLTNEGAIEIFPQKENQEQFIKAGAGYQMLKGDFGNASERFSNLYLFGEYRNRTRNDKWDIEASGRFYLAGLNAADYNARISLATNIGEYNNLLQVGFENVNRTPSFVFDPRSSFLLLGNPDFKKENWLILTGNIYLPRVGVHLSGKYYVVSNYTYWEDYYKATQQSTLQNIIHLGVDKVFNISKHWKLYTEAAFQQTSGVDINLPDFYTRDRIAYEGQFYRNLSLATGIEMRYFTSFKADNWSPFNQQWVVNRTESISNRPDIAAFLHFRIRGLRIYIRAENLNTVDFSNGFKFSHNNFAAPLYPTPGFIFRFGFYWSFVN